MGWVDLVLGFVGALAGGIGAARWSYRRSRLDDLLEAAPEYAAILRRIGTTELEVGELAGDPHFDVWQQRMAPHLVDLPAQLRVSFTHEDLASADPAVHGARLMANADELDAFTMAEAEHRDRWSITRRLRARRLARRVPRSAGAS